MDSCLRRPWGVVVVLCALVLSCAPAVAEPGAKGLKPAEPLRFEFLSVARAVVQVERSLTQVIDARPVMKYIAGHVPGAISIRDEQLRAHAGGLPTRMLGGTELGALFGRAGIDGDRPVLVYADGDDPLSATFVAYALVRAGHRRVNVLSGGFGAWQGAGSTTQDVPSVAAREWTAVADDGVAATIDDVRLALKREEIALVDARPGRLYRGETRTWKRNGHIPGAASLDWHTLVQSDNESLMKSGEEIGKAIDAAGLDSSGETIVYCGTGREATLVYLTLRGTLKWPRVRLYEGSWTEYSGEATLPVVIGTEARPSMGTDGDVTISGQPTADMLREMADRGYRLVINCRSESETRKLEFDEGALVEALGMTYVEVPLGGGDGYAPEDVAKLEEALRTREGPGMRGENDSRSEQANGAATPEVLLHCAGGGRSATLWAAYLVKHRGLSASDAIERVRATGMLHETSLERLLDEKLLPRKAE